MVQSRRRCALCFGLGGDVSEKRGQIAHVDRDASNSVFDNLAFLCMNHHDQYDSKTSQSKGLNPEELKTYRDRLYDAIKEDPLRWPGKSKPEAPKKTRKAKGRREPLRDIQTLELYDRRITIYRAAISLMARIAQSASVEMKEASDFAKHTDEALFLFDDDVDAYLDDMYRRAMKLSALQHALDGMPVGDKRTEVVNEAMELVMWFAGQFGVLRGKLKPFLRVER